jgi:hypothetical protein
VPLLLRVAFCSARENVEPENISDHVKIILLSIVVVPVAPIGPMAHVAPIAPVLPIGPMAHVAPVAPVEPIGLTKYVVSESLYSLPIGQYNPVPVLIAPEYESKEHNQRYQRSEEIL